jgi:lipopolysaccharide/colanic/teichoic acid biosynthesis glycosyltransferase
VARKRLKRPSEESFGQKYLKRAFDLAAASLALVVLAPVFAFVAFLIKAASPGPVFFRQERTGRGGKPFFIYKFRTMVKDAPEFGPDLTGAGDPRITRVGHILRVTKLDELPNLFNVVRGEMSVVGPRPELPRFMSALTPEQRIILRFRPGITGPTQIRYVAEEEFLSPVNIDENYVDNVFADKIASDLAYVSNWSFREDISLISYTAVALVFKVFGRVTKLFPLQRPRRLRDDAK